MLLLDSMILLGQWGHDELINSFELIEVCVTKCYDFGRPYTTDPPIKEAKKISTGPYIATANKSLFPVSLPTAAIQYS
jgi:hypothetical protein